MLLVPSGASGNVFVFVFVFVIAAGCDATSASGNVSRSRERLRRTKSLQNTLNETLNNVEGFKRGVAVQVHPVISQDLPLPNHHHMRCTKKNMGF